MRTTKTLTISMPPGMVDQVKKVSKEEYRTPSELVREALRSYFFQRLPIAEPTVAEHKAIARGRAAYQRGEYRELSHVLNDLEARGHKTRRKRTK